VRVGRRFEPSEREVAIYRRKYARHSAISAALSGQWGEGSQN